MGEEKIKKIAGAIDKWIRRVSRQVYEGVSRPEAEWNIVAQFGRLFVGLRITLYVCPSRDTLLTVHAYWAIPRHECRHKLPVRCLTSLSRSLRSHRGRASRAHPITWIQIVSDFQRDFLYNANPTLTLPFRPALHRNRFHPRHKSAVCRNHE